jgi:nucleoside-diphosphate-sugar epimerase
LPDSVRSSQKILLTGAAGFIGSALARRLASVDATVTPLQSDLTDWRSLKNELQNKTFDSVVHLGAQSHVPTVEQDPDAAFRINTMGTMYLAELSRSGNPAVRFIFASTAHVYGVTGATEIISETSSITPLNTYAMTKRMAEIFLSGWVDRNPKVRCEVLRFFNHSHKSQSPDFFLPRMYQELLRAKKCGESTVEISVGNVDIERDIGSLDDLISALTCVVVQGHRGDQGLEHYNIGSGVGKNLRSLTQCLAKKLGIHVELVVDPARVRVEPQRIIADISKAKAAFGWSPQAITEEALIDAFLKEFTP